MVVCKCQEAECIWHRMIIRLVSDSGDDGGDDDVKVEVEVNDNEDELIEATHDDDIVDDDDDDDDATYYHIVMEQLAAHWMFSARYGTFLPEEVQYT